MVSVEHIELIHLGRNKVAQSGHQFLDNIFKCIFLNEIFFNLLTHMWVTRPQGVIVKMETFFHNQSGTKPNLVAKILATNFGDHLA